MVLVGGFERRQRQRHVLQQTSESAPATFVLFFIVRLSRKRGETNTQVFLVGARTSNEKNVTSFGSKELPTPGIRMSGPAELDRFAGGNNDTRRPSLAATGVCLSAGSPFVGMAAAAATWLRLDNIETPVVCLRATDATHQSALYPFGHNGQICQARWRCLSRERASASCFVVV